MKRLPPVVLVHASGLGGASLRRLANQLPGLDVRAPNLPGYPRCEAPVATLPRLLDVDAEAIEGCLEQLDAPALLFGHSYGGRVAMEVARRGRAPLTALAVFEPVMMGVLAASRFGPRWSRAARESFASLAQGAEAFVARLVDYWGGPGSWQRLPAQTRRLHIERSGRIHAEVSGLVDDPAGPDAWATLEVPTLVLRGDHDHAEEEHVCDLLVEALPEGRLQVVSGGHLTPVTHPERVAGALRRLAGYRAADPE